MRNRPARIYHGALRKIGARKGFGGSQPVARNKMDATFALWTCPRCGQQWPEYSPCRNCRSEGARAAHKGSSPGRNSDQQTDNLSAARELSAEEWKRRAYAAMRRAKQAETKLETLVQSSEGTQKFEKLKREFARLYHPDYAKDDLSSSIRSFVFKEFWPIIQEIDRK